MLYEEPEYARQVQIRFLQNGLQDGDCCIYGSPDDESLNLTKTGMLECGLDVDRYTKEGVLQFHKRIPSIQDPESYRKSTIEFMESIEDTFRNARTHAIKMPPRIRGVGSIQPFVFAHENVDLKASSSQLLVEKLWQSESTDSFDGIWMCIFQVHDILASMEQGWMKELVTSHDAAIYLPRLSNGVALDVRK
jgi:hypothetical protein